MGTTIIGYWCANPVALALHINYNAHFTHLLSWIEGLKVISLQLGVLLLHISPRSMENFTTNIGERCDLAGDY